MMYVNENNDIIFSAPGAPLANAYSYNIYSIIFWYEKYSNKR